MAHLTMTAPHRLEKDEVLRRVKDKLGSLVAGYARRLSDLHERWNEGTLSFGFRAVGMRVSGTVTVNDSEVLLAADVPFAVMLFKNRIDKRVRAELGALLN
jgi:hypothetical protein